MNNRPVNKEYVLGVIEDTVADLLYYNRREDESLVLGRIELMVEKGEITIDEMVEQFRKSLIEGIR